MRRDNFSLERIRAHNCRTQHILPGSKSVSLVEIARDAVGLHAARLSSPYVASWTRSHARHPADLRAALFDDAHLIKLRCMRTTLHILPPDVAAIAHRATLELRTTEPRRRLEQIGVHNTDLQSLRDRVLERVATGPSTSWDIEQTILKANGLGFLPTTGRVTAARAMLKLIWEEGTLCYINESRNWAQEQRVYDLTARRYPHFELRRHERADAIRMLVERYVIAYGPVTVADICWWSGLPKSVVVGALRQLDLTDVSIANLPGSFVVITSDLQSLIQRESRSEDWIELLAYEDPFLKAYGTESRLRYVSSRNYASLFNQIGEARPSIMLNGEIVGLWTWSPADRCVRTQLFRNLTRRLQHKLEERVSALQLFLRADLADTRQ